MSSAIQVRDAKTVVTLPVGELSLADAERQFVEATLAHTHGNIFRASILLEISYTGLRLKLKRWKAQKD